MKSLNYKSKSTHRAPGRLILFPYLQADRSAVSFMLPLRRWTDSRSNIWLQLAAAVLVMSCRAANLDVACGRTLNLSPICGCRKSSGCILKITFISFFVSSV